MLTPNTFYVGIHHGNGSKSTEVSEARRHPKIVTLNHPQQNVPQKKEFEYNEYEFPPGNGHPGQEGSGEIDIRQQEHEQEQEALEHVQHHHEHHEHVHVHPKHISHHPPHHHHHHSHPKKPGYSSGSGLRSIAQGSADQASSAVHNQVLY